MTKIDHKEGFSSFVALGLVVILPAMLVLVLRDLGYDISYMKVLGIVIFGSGLIALGGRL